MTGELLPGDVAVHRDRQTKEDSLSTLVFREDSSTRPQPSPETLVAFDRRSDAFEPAHPGQLAHHGPAPAVGPFGRIFRKRDQPVVRADDRRSVAESHPRDLIRARGREKVSGGIQNRSRHGVGRDLRTAPAVATDTLCLV